MAYALITGASRGIGLSIAIELAKRNINLILIARDEVALKENARVLNEKYQIVVDILAIDLTEQQSVETILSWLSQKNYEVNMLINNAGYGLSGQMNKYSLSEHENMMHLNMNVPVRLVYALLPMLSAQEKAYIMNVGSCASYQAIPGLNIYAASKSFILSFSRGLSQEPKKTAISVSVVSPGATDTAFPDRARVTSKKAIRLAKATNMSPEQVAKVAVEGMLRGETEIITGALNKLGVLLTWLLPKKLVEKNIASIYCE